MNELSNGFGAMPDGLSAVSVEDLNRVEGGALHEISEAAVLLDTSSMKGFYQSIANWCKDLDAMSRM